MRAAKKICVSAFSKCKKAEDATVRLIYDCMNFDTQPLNTSAIAAEAGANISI